MSDFDPTRLRELKKQAFVLTSEIIKRRASDPLRSFQPHPKQLLFMEAVRYGPCRENWFVAANRAGKSDAGASLGSQFARFGMPDWEKTKRFVGGKGSEIQIADRATAGWVVAVDFPSSRDVIQPKYFNNGFMAPDQSHQPFIPEYEIADWRAGDQILKLNNGSIIGFKSCDSGARKFQGTEKQWVHFDEEPDHEVYKETSIRIGGTPLTIFGTCTILPEEGRASSGISWLFPTIIDPWKKGSRKIGVFQASIYDNPHLSASQIRELEDKYPEGGTERRIRLDGELLSGLLGSRAYSAFSSALHVRPQPPIFIRRPLAWAMDFNVTPMSSLLIQREGNLIRVFREIIIDGEGIPAMADRFHEIMPSMQSEVYIYGDATSKRRTGQTGKSDYYILMNALRQWDYQIRMKVPDENPHVPDRINAVNQALKNSLGESCIEIDPSCTELIADLEQVVRDKANKIKKVTDPRDPYFKRTHTSDALGYYVSYEMPVKANSKGPVTGRKKTTMIREPKYGARR